MAIGSIKAGFGSAASGSLGTLFVRLAADSTDLDMKMDSAGKKVSSTAANIVKSLALIGGAIAGLAYVSVREANKFESSFAGVRKTVNATEEEFKQLEMQFRSMAKQMPINVNEINNIAAAAGQLGIKTENLKEFTRVMALLGVTTNLTSDQAATQLARFANITGMSQKNFDRLGSTIVALGNKSATTESEISSMALRIAGAGSEVGLSEHQILGFAAALSSVGIEAEAGGTAMSQAMVKMAKAVKQGGDELESFAAGAGLNVADFTELFEKDAAGAIEKFLAGMRSIKDQGGDVFTFMERMNLDGARMTDVITRAGRAHALFGQTLQTAQDGWEQNNALTKEAEQRFNTFDSQIQITWNTIKDLLITIGQGLVPGLKELNKWLKEVFNTSAGFNDQLKATVEKVAPTVILGIDLLRQQIIAVQFVWKSTEIIYYKMLTVLQSANIEVSNFISMAIQGVLGAIEGEINAVIDMVNSMRTKIFNLLPKSIGNMVSTPPTAIGHVSMGFSVDTTKQQQKLDIFESMLKTAKGELVGLGFDFLKVGNSVEDQWTRITEPVDKSVKGVSEFEKNAWQSLAATDALGASSGVWGRNMTRMDVDMDAINNKLGMMKINSDKVSGFLGGIGFPGNTRNVITSKNGQLDIQSKSAPMTRGQMGMGIMGAGILGQDQTTMQMFQLSNEIKLNEDHLKDLQKIKDLKIAMNDDEKAKLLQAEKLYGEQIKQMRLAMISTELQTSSKMFEDLSSMAKAWGGEQSGFYKAMFAASKAFAIADATVKIFQGVAAAASLPWPLNLGAMASVVAATASIVSNISSVQLAFGEGKSKGGDVFPNTIYPVGEKGPELFVPKSAGTILPNDFLNGGGRGGNTRIEIKNYGAQVTTSERQDGNEKVIEIMVRKADEHMAANIMNGTGKTPKAIEAAYGARRRG